MKKVIFDHPQSGRVSFVGDVRSDGLYRFKVEKDGIYDYVTFFDLLTIATSIKTIEDLSFAYSMMDAIQGYIEFESEAKMFMNSKWFLSALLYPALGGTNGDEKKTYLMRDDNTGLTKIGRASDPKIREKTLQSENPAITLFAICNSDIEKKLHKKFSKKRVRGEWFNLSNSDLDSIIIKYDFIVQDPNI